jgi:hypothetical protein
MIGFLLKAFGYFVLSILTSDLYMAARNDFSKREPDEETRRIKTAWGGADGRRDSVKDGRYPIIQASLLARKSIFSCSGQTVPGSTREKC